MHVDGSYGAFAVLAKSKKIVHGDGAGGFDRANLDGFIC
jgi:hypothetical protein